MTKTLPRYERRSKGHYPRYGYQPSSDFAMIDLWNDCAKFGHDSMDLIDRLCAYWNDQQAKPIDQILAEHQVTHFSVGKRNPYHWDISWNAPDIPDAPDTTSMEHGQRRTERAFRIRGGYGADILLLDERTLDSDTSRCRSRRLPTMSFPDMTSAMAFVVALFMKEKPNEA